VKEKNMHVVHTAGAMVQQWIFSLRLLAVVTMVGKHAQYLTDTYQQKLNEMQSLTRGNTDWEPIV
jgi:hypothetical protein